MKLLLITLCSLSLISLAQPVRVYSTEGPPFTLIKNAPTYQERYYPEAKWICHMQNLDHILPLLQYAYDSLLGYMEGCCVDANAPPKKILVSKHLLFETNGTVTFYLCFFIQHKYMNNIPTTLEKNIFVEYRPAQYIYVRHSFEEYFMNELMEAGEKGLDFEVFYLADYDLPMKWAHRPAEVWFVRR